MLHFRELRIVLVNVRKKFEKSYNLALFREHFHQYFEILMHVKLLHKPIFKTFKDFSFMLNQRLFEGIKKFKDLNKNCGMMFIFSKTFHGFHIYKDF